MRKTIAVCLLASLIACKGPKGDRGDSSGPSQIPPITSSQPTINQFSGTIGTGTALIGTSLHTNSVVLVYLQNASDPNSFVLLSIDPTTGPWAEINFALEAVNFHNCPSTSGYKILVINPGS